MKKKYVLFSLLLILILRLSIANAEEEKRVEVTIADYNIRLNDVLIDSVSYEYPPIVYKGIVYLPMTSDFTKAMGINFKWDENEGIEVSKSEEFGDFTQTFLSGNNGLGSSEKAFIVDLPIKINGNEMDNSMEEYPILNFRYVTYLPMTYRFTSSEFDWEVDWDSSNGLSVITQDYETWCYYIDEDDNSSLYKIKIGGNERIKLIDGEVVWPKVENGWIYYKLYTGEENHRKCEYYKMRTGGTEKTKLLDEASDIELKLITDQWIYYTDFRKDIFCKMKTDGTENIKLLDYYCDSVVLDGEYLYMTKENDGYRDTVYRMKLDGSGLEEIKKRRYNGKLYGFDAFEMQTDKEWIYYNEEIPYVSDGSFYRVQKNGLEKQSVVTDIMWSWEIYKDWIYYSRGTGAYEKELFKIRVDGSEKTKLCEDMIWEEIEIYDGWIYYINLNDNNCIYRIKTDGTGKMKVSNNGTRSKMVVRKTFLNK